MAEFPQLLRGRQGSNPGSLGPEPVQNTGHGMFEGQ